MKDQTKPFIAGLIGTCLAIAIWVVVLNQCHNYISQPKPPTNPPVANFDTVYAVYLCPMPYKGVHGRLYWVAATDTVKESYARN